jgi:ribonucleoside-diphosphate reductase alpha chain
VAVSETKRRVPVCLPGNWHNGIQDFLKLRINTGDERRRTLIEYRQLGSRPFHEADGAQEDWTLFRSTKFRICDAYGRKFEERYTHYERLAKRSRSTGARFRRSIFGRKCSRRFLETGHPG